MTQAPFEMRTARAADGAAMLALLQQVCAEGDTLPFVERVDASLIDEVWLAAAGCMLALDPSDASVLGMYRLGSNMPGRGAHIASATYLVAANARGKGIGRALVADSLLKATALGFRGMQFNQVVAGNVAAVALYESMGFAVTGRTPGGFRDDRSGFVDTLIMFRPLGAA